MRTKRIGSKNWIPTDQVKMTVRKNREVDSEKEIRKRSDFFPFRSYESVGFVRKWNQRSGSDEERGKKRRGEN